MKFVLYHSKSEQCYTLLEKENQEESRLEDDATAVHIITATDWDDAKAQQELFLNKVI